MSEFQTPIDKPYGQTDEARTHAIARVSREPQADLLLVMLGLADDPVAAERRAAKAKAMLAGHSSAPTRGAR